MQRETWPALTLFRIFLGMLTLLRLIYMNHWQSSFLSSLSCFFFLFFSISLIFFLSLTLLSMWQWSNLQARRKTCLKPFTTLTSS